MSKQIKPPAFLLRKLYHKSVPNLHHYFQFLGLNLTVIRHYANLSTEVSLYP